MIADGLKLDTTTAATDGQIDAWAAAQGASTIPLAVREVLRLIGHRHRRWLAGSAYSLEGVDKQTKRSAIAHLAVMEHSMVDPAGMLVLVEHQAYEFYVIDGADLNEPDPPVWWISEQEAAEVGWSKVTDWFEAVAPNVKDDMARLELKRQSGRRISPGWAECYDLEWLKNYNG
ncbi:hypothetical protein [Nocardia sp. NPDC052566]|uniref:hypothetical protein n=1 Tax=Nocardia sp. NPDC052566 TaxID=3364330 RepID=UPI0037C8528C